MINRIFYILILLFLFLSACGKQKKENLIEESDIIQNTPNLTQHTLQEDTVENYLDDLPFLETPIREYGEETGYIQLEQNLMIRILYPEGEIVALNHAIEDWVNKTVSYYHEESDNLNENDETAELTAEYDSYIINDEIVSVKISGFYDRPHLAHPMDIIATFHANIKTGKLLSLEDVLLSNGEQILREKIIADASINEDVADEHLLDFWTLKNDGLEIILARGDYFPMSEGTVTLLYRYKDITEIFSFRKKNNWENTSDDREIQSIPTEEAQNIIDDTVIELKKPMIALTFDDGPSKHTERLLDIFYTYGGKGTFFVVGNLLNNRSEVLQQMVAEGHEIAGHSWDHRQLTKLDTEDLTNQLMTTRAKILELTGIDSTLLRPPYGSYNEQIKNVCKNLGIYMVNWSLDTLDWKYRDANRIYNTIMDEVKDGDIILCHDLHGTTVDSMERVIPDLIEKGYQLVTVSELLSRDNEDITPGSVYNKKY